MLEAVRPLRTGVFRSGLGSGFRAVRWAMIENVVRLPRRWYPGERGPSMGNAFPWRAGAWIVSIVHYSALGCQGAGDRIFCRAGGGYDEGPYLLLEWRNSQPSMQYRLRTLLFVLGFAPPVLALVWWAIPYGLPWIATAYFLAASLYFGAWARSVCRDAAEGERLSLQNEAARQRHHQQTTSDT